MTKQEIFEIACDLACHYHEGQTYQDEGDYYTNHLLGVSINALQFSPAWLNPLDVQTVGVLHDILEDTSCTEDILLGKGIPAFIVEAVVLLSKSPNQDSEAYLRNLMTNPLSHCVKIGDSHFNLTNSLIARNARRVIKYTGYLKKLGSQ